MFLEIAAKVKSEIISVVSQSLSQSFCQYLVNGYHTTTIELKSELNQILLRC